MLALQPPNIVHIHAAKQNLPLRAMSSPHAKPKPTLCSDQVPVVIKEVAPSNQPLQRVETVPGQ